MTIPQTNGFFSENLGDRSVNVWRAQRRVTGNIFKDRSSNGFLDDLIICFIKGWRRLLEAPYVRNRKANPIACLEAKQLVLHVLSIYRVTVYPGNT